MDSGDTRFAWIKREITAWRQGFMTNPLKTLFLGLGLVVLIGLGAIAPRVFNDMYSSFVHQAPQNPFSGTQTIHSNPIPFDYDIIDLDKAGTLTPSPNNARYSITQAGQCSISEEPLIDQSLGIVLILNAAPILSSNPTRGMQWRPPADSQLFTFTVGTTHTIKTGERVFTVTLSRINDLSTKENGAYFSYVFNINEK